MNSYSEEGTMTRKVQSFKSKIPQREMFGAGYQIGRNLCIAYNFDSGRAAEPELIH